MASWGAVGMQGWRTGMEDTHIADKIDLPDGEEGLLFGVFDGHGGQEVATFAKEKFKKCFINQAAFKSQKYADALTHTFRDVDDSVKYEEYAADTGSTSCVVFITPKQIFCANAGDSRAVLCRKGQAMALSFDHKPQNDEEQQRIEKASHFVSDERVDGNLALSRAFGDYQYKDQRSSDWKEQAVTASPDVMTIDRSPDDEFIIDACDGIWDCLSNDEACTLISEKLKKTTLGPKDYHKPVEQMLD
jgi:protein phosphatase 2C family protein 2/3